MRPSEFRRGFPKALLILALVVANIFASLVRENSSAPRAQAQAAAPHAVSENLPH